MVDYRTPFVSDSELETRLKFSRSQKSTRLSAPPEASRNSCGWNSTSFTDAVCSRSSDNNRPARKSHIFYIEKTVSQGKHTFTWGLRKRKKKKNRKHGTRFIITHLYGAVLSGRSHPLAVGTESQAIHSHSVTFISEDASLAANIPQLQQQKREKKTRFSNNRTTSEYKLYTN